MPIERFKDSYENWRYNPFSGESLAVDKIEDNLEIPISSPFVIQLLEVPRKDNPSTVSVYCYDDELNFTEASGSPAQGQFRVDYPDPDGHGTGLIEFNSADAGKTVKITYKATGSPIIKEFLDTKLSYPAGDPDDNQIIAFKNGAPEFRFIPIRYFHEGNVLYHQSGEDESCLRFLFKKSANESKIFLFLKGVKLHQGFYTELKSHTHGVGTLAVGEGGSHTHVIASHSHGAGTLSGSQPAHTHGYGTLAVSSVADHSHDIPSHSHGLGTLAVDAVLDHQHGAAGGHSHDAGTLSGSQPTHTHPVSGNTDNTDLAHSHNVGSLAVGSVSDHTHVYDSGDGVPDQTSPSGGHSHSLSGSTSNWNIANLHKHSLSLTSGAGGDDSVTISGSTGSVNDHQHGAAGGHGHSLSGALAGSGDLISDPAGGHNHTLSGATGAGGDDAVSISGETAGSGDLTSGSGGSHTHALSGETASAGDTPKTYPDSLKVYINDVDKTTDILSKSGLDKLGDGSGTHTFVTAGTGEIDISDLITSNGIHEIKITEPTAGKGGRVLLHLEVY